MMKAFLDLSDHAKVKSYHTAHVGDERAQLFMDPPESDPRYMPVTRDLSRNKRDMIRKWTNAGCP